MSLLRKFLRGKKRDATIDWIRNDDLRQHVTTLMAAAFQLDRNMAQFSLEVVLLLVDKQHPEDLELAKKIATPLAEAWMLQQYAANREGKIALDSRTWVPVAPSGLKWGGIIPADVMERLTQEDAPAVDDPLEAAAASAVALPTD